MESSSKEKELSSQSEIKNPPQKRNSNFLSKLFKAKLKRTIFEEKKVIEEARKTNIEKIIELLNEYLVEETNLNKRDKLNWAIQKLQIGKFYECEKMNNSSIVGGFFSEIAKIYNNFSEQPLEISDIRNTHRHKTGILKGGKGQLSPTNSPSNNNISSKHDLRQLKIQINGKLTNLLL